MNTNLGGARTPVHASADRGPWTSTLLGASRAQKETNWLWPGSALTGWLGSGSGWPGSSSGWLGSGWSGSGPGWLALALAGLALALGGWLWLWLAWLWLSLAWLWLSLAWLWLWLAGSSSGSKYDGFLEFS